MRHAYLAAGLFLSSICVAAEWGSPRQLPNGRNAVEVSSASGKVALIWQSEITPGGDLPSTTSVIGTNTFYGRYVFVGVTGGSMHVSSDVAIQSQGTSRSGPPSQRVFFVEQAPNGRYYFIPEELKNEAVVRAVLATGRPGYYSVSIER